MAVFKITRDGHYIADRDNFPLAKAYVLSIHSSDSAHYDEIYRGETLLSAKECFYQLKPKDIVEEIRHHVFRIKPYDYHNQRYDPADESVVEGY